ncbi:MAG TPA: UDP-N-acetylglucosamine--LPS N-acetylglucosamine transferase [Solirubrobacterales bacterium]|nr:UDP-N-acetylglucosamine--LPS N-acetylglucosamine transferase [Solirubrobacterales bacterium]
MEATTDGAVKALLVCSPGGHLLQMLCLQPAWNDLTRVWVTLEAADSKHLLRDERVVIAHGPTNRSLGALLANMRLAWRVVRHERPDVILSTGAALAFPFFLAGKLHGTRLVYVESLTRIRSLSLTGRLIHPLADALFVQWPEAAGGKARFEGGLL